PIDLSEFDTGGRRTPSSLDGYLYTERGIYRPGETVHLTAMVRDRAGRAMTEGEGTLVTYRPNGVEAERIRFSLSQAGSLQYDVDLPESASRGRWRTTLEIDGVGQVGRVFYAVEDFVPQRIAVELDTDDAPLLSGDAPRAIEVSSRFLYGAPGAGLTVQGQVRLEPDPSPFETFEAFQWGRHDGWFNERIIDLNDRTTDATGQATMRLNPGDRGADADRPLRLNTVVSVLEPGGRAVSESVRIPFRPQSSYLGTRAAFDGRLGIDEPANFEIATLSDTGAPLQQTVNWKLLAIDFHYDWYRDNGNWRWRRSRTVRTVNSGQLTTDDGVVGLSVNGLDWGQHELVVESEDGKMASRSFYVGWGGDVSTDGVEAPDRVDVLVDEQIIVPGRPAAVTIFPPYDGEAQIVVATDRVLSVETRPVQASGTEITLSVTEEWGEGAYVMVNVYTERDPIVQAKPRRAVGVGYVPVSLDARKFDVSIDAPELARPEQTQTVSVTVEGGPSERTFVTLAAVDEGILRLTKFEDPDPVDWYFGRKALGVAQYDDYGRLLDPNLGLPAEVRSGGDQLGGEGLSVVPTRTVALFSGVVEVGRNSTANVEFELPPFNGELRLMAVAWSQSGLGATSQAMTVRDEAPADLILPRFMAPGDTAIATVSVDNVELEDGTFEIDLASTEPISVAAPEIETMIPTGQRLDQGMRISAEDSGIARLRLRVSGPDNYQTSRTYPIETRSPFLPVTTTSKALMEPGQTFAPDPELLASFVPGTAQVSVSFSGLPVDSNALYHSLSQYPYGCTEQATSRALPLIYSEQLVDPGEGDLGARVRVQEAISTLLNRQNGSGAFGLWREGDNAASPWLGAYTTDFLYRARDAGYEVPRSALERAYSALSGVAEGDAWRVYGYRTDVYEGRYHSDTEEKMMHRASAYALYVLARAGQADISRLRYLHDRELSQIGSPLARAHIGAGLALMGDRARATSAFNAAEEALGYDNSGDYYQTPLRDLSGVIALASEVGFNDH
ncbi:MAG: MG2 domain-containing protein, partial [Pseudomonadota bacterium]